MEQRTRKFYYVCILLKYATSKLAIPVLVLLSHYAFWELSYNEGQARISLKGYNL